MYSKLYGQRGRLHPSNAGLTAISPRGDHLTLAQREYSSMVARFPERFDLTLALAEVRWRAGDDGGAQQLCQQVLAARPQAVRAFYILADLFRRHGAPDRAQEAFSAAAAVDPLGDIARQLEAANPACSFAALALPAAEVPAYDPTAAPAAPSAGAMPVSAAPTAETTPAARVAPTTNTTLGVTPPPVEESEWERLSSELSMTGTAMPAEASAPNVAEDSLESLLAMGGNPPAPAPAAPAPAAPVATAVPEGD